MKKRFKLSRRMKVSLILLILYAIAKTIVIYTPTTVDDELPDKIRDQIKIFMCVTNANLTC